MKRAIWIGVLAVLAFVAILAVRMPASWLAGFLPDGTGCGQISGTAWNGSCAGFVAQGNALGDLTWKLHAASLLSGKLAANVAMRGPAGSVNADVFVRGRDIEARGLRADISLDPALLAQSPPDLRGHIRAELQNLLVHNGIVTGIEGRIDATGLTRPNSRNGALGDYVVTFPARAASSGDEPVGDVRSMKGPFDVEATLKLTREPGFELEGMVGASPDAPPELLQELQILGRPDARGRRPFSAAGTF